jgi:hypothetical protein
MHCVGKKGAVVGAEAASIVIWPELEPHKSDDEMK